MDAEQAIYGVAVRGLGAGAGPPAPDDWPRWEVAQQVGQPSGREGMSVWEDTAWIGGGAMGEFRLDRRERRAELVTPAPWSPEALLHPGLGPVATVIAHWMGRASLHCAAVLVDGVAWGLLGDSEAGKSTTAAWLGELGCEVLTDDVLVLEGDVAFAGPRSVDLREDAAGQLGGRALGHVGARERWRRPVSGAPLTAPLAGWVELCWGDGPTWAELGVAERFAILDRAVGLPPDGVHILLLADRPSYRFQRPRVAANGDRDAAHLLGLLHAQERAAS
jgi:hypothetical protein